MIASVYYYPAWTTVTYTVASTDAATIAIPDPGTCVVLSRDPYEDCAYGRVSEPEPDYERPGKADPWLFVSRLIYRFIPLRISRKRPEQKPSTYGEAMLRQRYRSIRRDMVAKRLADKFYRGLRERQESTIQWTHPLGLRGRRKFAPIDTATRWLFWTTYRQLENTGRAFDT